MSALKFILYIVLVISTLCIVSSVYMTSCNSTFIRKWDEHWIDTPYGENLRANVTTTRVHSPGANGRFGKDDELQYRLCIEPASEAFAAETLKFLDYQSQFHAELCFFNDETSQRYASIPLDLTAVRSGDKIMSYQAVGAIASKKSFGSGSEWSIIWKPLPQKALPKATTSSPATKSGLPAAAPKSGSGKVMPPVIPLPTSKGKDDLSGSASPSPLP